MIDKKYFYSNDSIQGNFNNGIIICDPIFLFRNSEKFKEKFPKEEDYLSGAYCIGISANGNKIYKYPDVNDYPDVRYETIEEFSEYSDSDHVITLEEYENAKKNGEVEYVSDLMDKEIIEYQNAVNKWAEDKYNYLAFFNDNHEDNAFGLINPIVWHGAFGGFFDEVSITCCSTEKNINGKTITIKNKEVCVVGLDDVIYGDQNIFNDIDYIFANSIVIPNFKGSVTAIETGPIGSNIITIVGNGNITFTTRYNIE